eukprot:2967321-Rhodomonas_salina.1
MALRTSGICCYARAPHGATNTHAMAVQKQRLRQYETTAYTATKMRPTGLGHYGPCLHASLPQADHTLAPGSPVARDPARDPARDLNPLSTATVVPAHRQLYSQYCERCRSTSSSLLVL